MADGDESPEDTRDVVEVTWPGTESFLPACRTAENRLLLKLPTCFISYGGKANSGMIGDRKIPCSTYRCREIINGKRCPASIKLLNPSEGDIA